MSKRFLVVAIIALSSISLFAQLNDFELDSILNEVLAEDEDLYDLFDGKTNYHFIYYDISYNNRLHIDGRDILESMYFYDIQGNNPLDLASQNSNQSLITNTLYYFTSTGIYVGLNGNYFPELDTKYRMTIVSAGYSNELFGINYRASFDRFFYHTNNFDPSFENSINTGLSYHYERKIGIRMGYSHMFGKAHDNVLFSSIYANIKLFDLGGYDRVRLEPQVLFNFGNDEYDVDIEPGDPTDPWHIPNYVHKKEFGLLNLQFQLPLTVSYKDFLFEIAYIHNLPQSFDPVYSFSNTNAMKLSIGYFLSLN